MTHECVEALSMLVAVKQQLPHLTLQCTDSYAETVQVTPIHAQASHAGKLCNHHKPAGPHGM